ncbi:MAG: tetratricopeptide repeat protein [Desulfovibrionaceae bacterium]|nr:tetratricopeptide repeat protein [Desulfovibrionaceae bacterium]
MSVAYGSHIPRDMREDLVRAFGYLERDNPLKAIERIVCALRRFNALPVSAQKNVSSRIRAFLDRLAVHPRVKVMLEVAGQTTIPYTYGKERALAVVLDAFGSMLSDQERVTREARNMDEGKARQARLFASGKEHLSLGQTRLAVAFFERLLLEFPKDTSYCLPAGQALVDAHLYAEAAAFYRKVVDTHEHFAPAYTPLLDILLQLEDFVGAEALLGRALRIFGEHPKTLLRLALLYELLGRDEEALVTVERVLRLDGTLSQALELKERLLTERDMAESGQKLP